MEVKELLLFVEKNKASDLHLSTTQPPIMRLHGDMVQMKLPKLTLEDIDLMLKSVMTEKQYSEF